MNLANLHYAEGSRKNRKKVGRGGAHGKQSTRGHKGQHSRSGANFRAWFEGGQMPITRRIPKRGFKNPMRRVVAIVNIEQLKGLTPGTLVDRESLTALGLVSGRADGIKILGTGEINFPLSFRVDQVSRGARNKIEAAGGKIVEVS